MIVVADASPLNYLILIRAVDVLQPLYGRVLVPQTVAGELQNANTSAAVRAWIALPPAWCEIREDPPSDPALASLDPGERAAIVMAMSISTQTGSSSTICGSRRSRTPPFARDRHARSSGRCTFGWTTRFRTGPYASFRLHPDIERQVCARIATE